MAKKTILIILSALIGIIIGYFGVLVSVFADGAIKERIITIGIILLIYMILSFLLGLIYPEFSWKWGILLGFPGVLFLALYSIKEYNFLYLIYIFLILCLSAVGSFLGGVIKDY